MLLEISSNLGNVVNANAITVTDKTACPNLLVDDSDCTSLAPGAACTLALTSNSPYAPCMITISGSNTANNPTTLIAFSYLDGLVFEESGGSGKVVIDAAQDFTNRWTATTNTTGAVNPFDGTANTDIIAANIDCTSDPANCAAQRCRNIGPEWYLPAIDELAVAYNELCFNATFPCDFGDFSNALYWSSTEFNDISAWLVAFPSGLVLGNNKNFIHSVRCIRTFS